MEHYLHNFAKKKFSEIYVSSRKFELTVASIYQNGYEVIDLKKLFPRIKVEEYDNSFVPDCLLFNDSGNKVYLEIKYKSAISEKKKLSGVPIIEIDVSNAEEFIRMLDKKGLDTHVDRVRLYNFKKAGLLPKTFEEYEYIDDGELRKRISPTNLLARNFYSRQNGHEHKDRERIKHIAIQASRDESAKNKKNDTKRYQKLFEF